MKLGDVCSVNAKKTINWKMKHENMKISQVKISNFRCYKNEITINMNDLTVFVGKNDVGKSTILEALDVFFNEGKGVIKIDKEDINKSRKNDDIEITVIFENIPKEIIIDSTNETTLEAEYLLNDDNKLEVLKRYKNAGKENVFIKAKHPSNSNCADLLLKKQKDLQKIIKEKLIACENQKKNAVMRKAIWDYYSDDLQLNEVEIDVTKEDAKSIWEQLKQYMPLYSLFQSDRKNSDGDSEIQDPMKLAVQEIIKSNELQSTFNEIAEKVTEKLNEIASNTLAKLNEMNPEIANSLKPIIPSTDSLKWADVFKSVAISGDQDIPINKRGSGVKRLVLLNFFRAEVERRVQEKNVPNIIYAIEEPETSQHPDHQQKFINAFRELSKQSNTQIILTTHAPSIVKMLDFEQLKLIIKNNNLKILNVEKNNLPYPSLNEASFLAFGESDENYHNELYGFIESERWIKDFQYGKDKREYIREIEKGKPKEEQKREQKILSEYIRHQIHHPENKHNEPYTREELRQSIDQMIDFIKKKSS